MATIADVATMAKVGVGTVSRVLNDSPNVKPETRARVLDAIAQLGYRPSWTARSLSSGKTRQIGVLASFFTEPAAGERLRGVVSTLTPSIFDVVLFAVETRAHVADRLHDLMRVRNIDGLIILSIPLDDIETALLLDSDMPAVTVDAANPRLRSITVDDIGGGRMATEHLLGLGHRRVAFLGDPSTSPFRFTSSNDRERGYRAAMEAAGLHVAPELVQHGQHGRAIAKALTVELLSLAEPPTAIFAASDTQALGVMEACTEFGLRIPQDLSLVGYDDIEVAAYVGLTTVSQPLVESGRRGAEVMMEMLKGEPAEMTSPVEDHLPLELVVRKTTAPPAR
jgi:DNA-binding LacI/PurR family transcriptional regulator